MSVKGNTKVCERQQTNGVVLPSLMDMEKKSVIIGGITGSIVGPSLLVLAAVAVSSASASNYNCIDIDRLRQKLERRVARGKRIAAITEARKTLIESKYINISSPI